jgi:1-acyl-sn-glycerol-3-phosphate acyltransferase
MTSNKSSRWIDFLLKYFRVEVKGAERIPRRGPALIIANHSGYSGFDALALAYMIRVTTGRRVRILAHRGFFDWFAPIRRAALQLGLREARVWEAMSLLKQGRVVVIFPEGEAGNFKSTFKRYRLQHFHSGFLRMAILSRVPVIPCLIIGAEESFPNWGNINLGRWVRGLRVPVPVTLLPLPARWSIEFLDSIQPSSLARQPRQARNRAFLDRTSERVRHRMQRELDDRLRRRGAVFL